MLTEKKMTPVIFKKVYQVDPNLETVAKVKPGEEFVVRVENAFGRSFSNLQEFEDFLSNDQEKKKYNHPCTGPIEIETEAKNISLAIHILDMKATRGYQCISKSTGLLKNDFQKRQCAIYDMIDESTLAFKEGDLLMRASPKLGFISTIDNQVRSCGRACENGGNIDLNFLDKGSTIYLPVNHQKARILVGDLHICQGNGEAAGIGIEADGEIKMKVEIVDKINFPIISHKQYMVIVGWGESVEQSFQCSTQNTIAYLKRLFPFSEWEKEDIYKFISAEGNLTVGNSTGKVKTCGMVFYKKRITNKFGFPVI